MGTVKSEQLTREDWLAIARKAMIKSGVDEVKIDVLARRMKVTRGSFYWHFESHQALLDALLDDWVANNRQEIASIEALVDSTGHDGVIEIFRIWLSEDPSFPAFDVAVRAWAHKSPKVARRVREIDEAWLTMLQRYLEGSGIEPPESAVRARIMYFHQVGYFALALKEELADRAKLAPYYYAALTGLPAPAGMVDELLAVKPKKPRK